MTDEAPAAPGRIVLLTASHRVAPGLLSWPAWQTLHAADRVMCVDADHPQLPYLREAGIAVEHTAPGAEELVGACAGGRTVVVLPAGVDDGTDARLTDGLARLAGSGRVRMPDLELLPGSYDLPGARLLDLVQVMDRIRKECPWSAGQTHKGLAKYAIEEAYELVEAIEDGDADELREELGDVLLQVVLHARIAQDGPRPADRAEAQEGAGTEGGAGTEDGVETEDRAEAGGADGDAGADGVGDGDADGEGEERNAPFSIDDVAGTIVAKMIHRHPHVFGDETAETAEEVKEHWLRMKGIEKQRASVTDGVPLGQPALALAGKLAGRVRTAGLDVEPPRGESVGYELLALAVRAEASGVDPETALRAAARVYRDRIRAAE